METFSFFSKVDSLNSRIDDHDLSSKKNIHKSDSTITEESRDKKRAMLNHDNYNTFESEQCNSMGYKSSLCRHFEAGSCKFGGLCQFAHGEEELNFYRKEHQNNKDSQLDSDNSLPAYHYSIQKLDMLEAYLDDLYIKHKNTLNDLRDLVKNLKKSKKRRSKDRVN